MKSYLTNYRSQLYYAKGLKKKFGVVHHALSRSEYPFPTHAKIEITGTCNAKCSMCCRPLMKNRDKIMSLDQFKTILGQLPYITEWSAHGCNEPMLHPQFFEFVEYANSKNVLFQLVTNGSRMTATNSWRFLALKPHRVKFSIDATNEMYEKIRKLSWATFYPNLVRFSKVFQGFYQQDLKKTKIYLAMAVFDETFPYILEVLDIARELDLWVVFSDLVLYDTESSGLKNTIQKNYSAEEIEETFRKVREYPKASINIGFPEVRSCTLPFSSIFIDVVGNVFPCGCVSHLEKYILGNVFEETVREIYNNAKYQKFRLDSCAGRIDECNKCKGFSLRLK